MMADQFGRWIRNIFILLIIAQIVSYNHVDTQAYGGGDALYQHESRLREALFSKYNLQMMPPANSSTPVTVKLGVSLLAIRKLCPTDQIMTTEAWIKMKWTDSRLKWEPRNYGEIKKLRVWNTMIWKPDIRLYNGAQLTDASNFVADTQSIIESDGGVIWIPPVTLRSQCAIDLKRFPYDQQSCKLKFGSWTVDGLKMDLQLWDPEDQDHRKPHGVDATYLMRDGGEWELTGSTATRTLRYYKCCKEPYTDLTYDLTLGRRSSFYGATIVCPVLAVVAIALASFVLSPFAYERITLNCLALFTLLLTLIHLSVVLPAAGKSVPIIAAFSGSLLVLVAIVTVGGVVFLAIERTGRTTPAPRFVTVVLKSMATKILLVGAQKEPYANHADTNNLDTESDDVKRQGQSEKEKNRRTWLTFYRFVDRVVLAVFVLILLLVLIISSC